MANDTHLVQYSMDATLYSRFHLPSSLPLMYDESVPIPPIATPPAASWFGKRPSAYQDVLPLMTAVAFSATSSSQHASLSDMAAASAKKVSSDYARFQEERQQRQQLLTEQYEAARRAKEEAAKLGDTPQPQLDANGTTTAVAQTKAKLEERGERLNQLDGKMQDLNANASEFLNNIKAYNQAMEKKKWYQL